MKITILGTGTSLGIPVIACECEVCTSIDKKDKRTRSSLLIETGDINIVIDAGPDFRCQMLKANVKHLDAILLTHEHKDHIGGLDDIRAFNWINHAPIDIYCDERVKKILEKDFDYAFSENKYPGAPDFDLHIVNDKPFIIRETVIIPFTVMHYKLPVTCYRIGKFAYITDANFISEESFATLKGIDYLVINALRKEEHISHFNLPQALEVIKKLGVKHAYITHMGHEIGRHELISKELPENVSLGYDMLNFEV